MKPPKFLITQNPKARTADVFIFHTQHPALLAKVLPFADAKGLTDLYRVGKTDAYLQVVTVYQEATPDAVVGVMQRMAAWLFYSGAGQ